MSDRPDTETRSDPSEFARQAEESSVGVVAEFVDFLRYNKKWWLIPIVIALAVVGVFVLVASGVAAPFIYTLF